MSGPQQPSQPKVLPQVIAWTGWIVAFGALVVMLLMPTLGSATPAAVATPTATVVVSGRHHTQPTATFTPAPVSSRLASMPITVDLPVLSDTQVHQLLGGQQLDSVTVKAWQRLILGHLNNQPALLVIIHVGIRQAGGNLAQSGADAEALAIQEQVLRTLDDDQSVVYFQDTVYASSAVADLSDPPSVVSLDIYVGCPGGTSSCG